MISVAGPVGLLRASASESSGDPLRSKRNAVVLLRWPLVIAAAYVMLFSGSGRPSLMVGAIAVALIASNVLVARLPEELVAHAGFDVILLVVDTIALSAGLYLTEAVSSDFYLLYFFVIFIAGVSERLSSVLMGSVLASVAYLSITLAGFTAPPVVLTPGSIALRVFFIFSVALFYGYLVERIRLDRERRQAEYVGQLETVNTRLRELVELRQAFLDSVSHELRSPLNALLGYIDLVRDGTVGEVKGPAQAYIHRAYNRGVHLMRLIEEVLNFSDISKGRTAVRLGELDINDLVQQIETSTRPVAEAKGLALQFDVAADVGPVVTDRDKLAQILLHLVHNAIEFTESGEVHIGVAQHESVLSHGWRGTVLECTIRDTGPGISPAEQESIFEDFRQLDGSTTRAHGGMGLGLSVCRGLVQLLRGEIRLESAVGKGTTFIVRLPVGNITTAVQADCDTIDPPVALAASA